MGCGCGGVKRSAARVPREQVVRGGQAQGANPGGFKWSGPQRVQQPKPVDAEPEVEAEPVPSAD